MGGHHTGETLIQVDRKIPKGGLMNRPFFSSLRATNVAVFSLSLLVAPALFADNVYIGPDGGVWNDPNNWDDGVVPPGGDTNVNIYGDITVNLSSPGMTTGTNHLRIGDGGGPTTSTLNILPGGSLLIDGSEDLILGREDLNQEGTLGVVNQTGGAFTANDYIKMSGDKEFAAGSLYQISGGTVQVVDQLQMGRDDSYSTRIEFKVIGSGATSIEINDVKIERNLSAQATFSFVIDELGVTPITVLDELQLGNNESPDDPGVGDTFLNVILGTTSQPPTTMTLFSAGRITMESQFTGLPDGSLIPVSFSGTNRVYQLNYVDLGDTEDVILTEIPEPTSLALLGLGGLALLRRRKRAS